MYRKVFLPAPTFDLVAEYAGDGVVIYWLEPNSAFYILAAYGIATKVTNKRLIRPENWAPQPAYQPAYVMDLEQACQTVLIWAGGAVLAYTIINNLSGIGFVDDIVTVPAGLYLINIGSRETFFAPIDEIQEIPTP